MKIPLFDIDGTLFKPGNKVHDDAFDHAAKKVFNVVTSKKDAITHGKIDSQILIELVSQQGISEEVIKAHLNESFQVMTEYFDKHYREENYTPLPYVQETLLLLQEQGISMGLLTGNVGKIAWKKLSCAEIDTYFSFGAFGDEAFKRVDLVRKAQIHAEKELKEPVSFSSLVIIGDTPIDIQCAQEAGIQSIAVATGIYTVDMLEEHKPDLTIESMKEKEKVLEFLRN